MWLLAVLVVSDFIMGDENCYSETKNEHGQTVLKLNHPLGGGVCEVYLYGATITKFVDMDGRDLIWLSSTAKLDGTKAIRGGIPLVFPHFGQPIKEMAQHGFARNNTWKIHAYPKVVMAPTYHVECTLSLDNTMATHEAWPHPYELFFIIKVFPHKLLTDLVVNNTGDADFRFQCLQHTYLEVQDIEETTVSGFQGGRYMDKTSSNTSERNIDPRATARVGEFTDRVYTNLNGSEVVVATPKGRIKVCGSGNLFIPDETTRTAEFVVGESCNTHCDFVMWNPWDEKAAGMADFDDDGYKRMLCIEPGAVSEFHVLPAKANFTLSQVVNGSPYDDSDVPLIYSS